VIASDLLRLQAAAGFPPEHRAGLSGRCVRAVAVATAVGAPLLEAVDGATTAEDDAAEARRAVQVASAQTRVVAAGLLAAPVLLVPGLGRLVGADLVGFYTTRAGVLVLTVGLGLLAAGAVVIALLVHRIGRPVGSRSASRSGPRLAALACGVVVWKLLGPALAPVAGLGAYHLAARSGRGRRGAAADGLDEAADLTATALAGGGGASQALRVAAGHLPLLAPDLHRLAFELELGLEPSAVATDGMDLGGERLRAVLLAADRLGAPAAPALRRLASDLDDRRADQQDGRG
jgi:Flp pilus assembly protein TadB